jgi:hypothetical protein
MISCGALRIASARFCFRLAQEVLAAHAARQDQIGDRTSTGSPALELERVLQNRDCLIRILPG